MMSTFYLFVLNDLHLNYQHHMFGNSRKALLSGDYEEELFGVQVRYALRYV